MPLAFASILVSSITLVSTSTNVVVSGLMNEYGLPGLAMFELAPVGIPIAVAGLLYTFVLARYLVPDRIPEQEITDISAHLYLTEVVIPSDSGLCRDPTRPLPPTIRASRLAIDGKAC
jgi:di/tricarboxylate transporter